jgi:hypothetical protein
MESLRNYLETVNIYIGASTFGRVFRLEGCGHVSIAYSHEPSIPLTSVAGERDQEHTVHYRDSCWINDILYYGIRNICQCAFQYLARVKYD